MTKISKKILICGVVALMSLAVIIMPFMYLKHTGKVYADSLSITFNSPTFAPTVVYKQNSSSFYSDSLHQFTFTPSISADDTGFTISFDTLYDVFNNSGGITSRTMNIYQYSTTTQITAPITATYNWGNTTVPNVQRSQIADIRFGVTSNAYNGIHCQIYAERTPLDELDTVNTYYDYFSPNLMYTVQEDTLVFTGAISGQTRHYALRYTDRHNVSVIFFFELSDNTALYNLYNNYVDKYLYFEGNSIYTSDDALQSSFNSGYRSGYSDGESDGYEEGYDAGDTAGYTRGYNIGDTAGYSRGLTDANNYTFVNLIGATIDAPIKALTGLLDFNILGINLSAFVYGLFSITLVIIVIKYIKGSK